MSAGDQESSSSHFVKSAPVLTVVVALLAYLATNWELTDEILQGILDKNFSQRLKLESVSLSMGSRIAVAFPYSGAVVSGKFFIENNSATCRSGFDFEATQRGANGVWVEIDSETAGRLAQCTDTAPIAEQPTDNVSGRNVVGLDNTGKLTQLENYITLFGLNWAMPTDQMIESIVARGYKCESSRFDLLLSKTGTTCTPANKNISSQDPNDVYRLAKALGKAIGMKPKSADIGVFSDEVEFGCEVFEACKYSTDELARLVVNTVPQVNELSPNVRQTSFVLPTNGDQVPVIITEYCGRGPSGDQICVTETNIVGDAQTLFNCPCLSVALRKGVAGSAPIDFGTSPYTEKGNASAPSSNEVFTPTPSNSEAFASAPSSNDVFTPAPSSNEVLSSIIETPSDGPSSTGAANKDLNSEPSIPNIANQENRDSSDGAAVAPSTKKPSFDCAKAVTRQETLICGDGDLSDLDKKLSVAYKEKLEGESDTAVLRNSQRQWLELVRNKCEDLVCLRSAYELRIQQIGN